ncbi:MAG: sugar phosphate isomerase/epimerase family protein [Frankia sp.]
MPEALDGIGWVLWAGTLGLQSPIEARLEAAAAGGFTRMSLSPLDVALAEKEGTTPEDLGRGLRDAGVDVVLDALMNWYAGEPPATSGFAAFTSDEALRMCEAVGAVSLTVLARPTCDVAVEEVAESFGTLCDRAADVGTKVQLEFMPMMAIKDLPSAWTIVQAADRPNGGLLFDTWHFFRGNPDFATLEELPGERIFAVQVSDGAAEIQGSIGQDTLNRRLPGDGCFDLARVLRTLDRIGGLGWVGPEVISPATEAMIPAEAARLAGNRVRDLIAQVRS